MFLGGNFFHVIMRRIFVNDGIAKENNRQVTCGYAINSQSASLSPLKKKKRRGLIFGKEENTDGFSCVNTEDFSTLSRNS